METAIVTSFISGLFALAAAMAAEWLKHYLERQRSKSATTRESAIGQPASGQGPLAFLRPVLIVIVSFVVGMAFRKYKAIQAQESLALFGLYSFILLAFIGLVLTHRRSSKGFWPYQLDCLGLWAAFASGYSLAYGHIWGDLIISTLMFWSGFAIVGGLIVRFTRLSSARSNSAPLPRSSP